MKSILAIAALLLASVTSFTQTLTEVILPKYIQGAGTFNEADDRRVPFAARLTITGLIPNATYFYFNTFVTDPTNVFNEGDGTFIAVADSGFKRIPFPYMGPGNRGEFKASAAGSYTGWFVTEPNSTFTYLPGTDIYLRVLLNDGIGGEFATSYLTTTSTVRVINFGADSTSGTGLRATPLSKAAAKQFVFLYDNFEASGRPVASTYVESDGTDGSLANHYAPFYADSVNGVNKAFGTIIPNQLPQGIKRIDLFELKTGAFKRSYFPYPVIETWSPLTIGFRWPSTNRTLIDTRNPTGGLQHVLVIDGSKVLGINLWLSSEASTAEDIVLQWNTPAEEEAVEYSVERSADGGKTYTAINTTRKGSNKLVYELKEARNEKVTWYRVVMRAKDGSKTISDALKVQGVIKLSTYPNPVANQLIVKHTAAEKGIFVQVVSADGRQVLLQNVKEGAVQTTVDVKTLVTGNYFLVYRNGEQRQSKLFVKQ